MADTPASGNDTNREALSVSQAASSLFGNEALLDYIEEPGNADEQPKDKVVDESEGEVTDDEALDPEQSDSEVDLEDEPPAKPKHKLKLGDEEVEVDEDELKAGYMRRSDYTRKTQGVAEERKQTQAEKDAISKERQTLAEKLKNLDETLKANTPQEPDWERLRREIPAEQLAARYIQWQEHKKRMETVSQARKEAEAAVKKDNDEKFATYVKGQNEKLIEYFPEWKDESKRKTALTKIAQYAINVAGFTQAELASVTDARVIRLLAAAQRQHAVSKATPDPRKQGEKAEKEVQKPGTQHDRKPVSKTERALRAHATDRSIRSGAAALEALLD